MKKTIEDIQVKGKHVFVRVDFNVPLHDGKITDDTRIKATLPTIKYLEGKGAKIILASHLGRPKGERKVEFSLEPVAIRLAELIDKPVKMLNDCIGSDVEEVVAEMKDSDIVLLENLRFHKEETKNNPDFAKGLANLADIAVNDAFAVSHRAHASVQGISEYIPMVSGYLLQKEIEFIGGAVNNPAKPFAAIIGGAKVSDKIEVISNLLPKVDTLIIGGGMANTFIAAQGYCVGNSLVEEDKFELAKQLLEQANEQGKELLLPIDFVVAKAFDNDAEHKIVPFDQIEEGWMALDIGPKSEELFAKALEPMKTIVWNGPMGVFEMSNYAHGTNAVAAAVAKAQGTTIVGGGDSVSAIHKSGLADQISHISTGGGASLSYLEGKELPGISSLAE